MLVKKYTREALYRILFYMVINDKYEPQKLLHLRIDFIASF